MSVRDGTILDENPDLWDVERIASLDWHYIRLCAAKAACMAMAASERLEIEGIKAFFSGLEKLVRMDDARRDREDLEEFRAQVKELAKVRDQLHSSGTKLMGAPPEIPH